MVRKSKSPGSGPVFPGGNVESRPSGQSLNKNNMDNTVSYVRLVADVVCVCVSCVCVVV